MAVVFSDLYGSNGLGFLVGDTASTSAADRKAAVNDAYVMLASIRGYWRKRSSDYTSSSSPALDDGTYQYNLPTSPGFDSAYRLYYLWAGKHVEVPILPDDQWLDRATIASTDKGFPIAARIIQTASAKRLELTPRINTQFINQIGTLTLEYFIEITRLSGDSDEPILPENFRHYIKYLAAKIYAIAQRDEGLQRQLESQGVNSMAEKGFAELRRHDLTRHGHTVTLRPRNGYQPHSIAAAERDYGGV